MVSAQHSDKNNSKEMAGILSKLNKRKKEKTPGIAIIPSESPQERARPLTTSWFDMVAGRARQTQENRMKKQECIRSNIFSSFLQIFFFSFTKQKSLSNKKDDDGFVSLAYDSSRLPQASNNEQSGARKLPKQQNNLEQGLAMGDTTRSID